MPADDKKVRARNRLSASRWNWLVDSASRDVTGSLAFADANGSHGRRQLTPDLVWYATLDTELTATVGTTATPLRLDPDTGIWSATTETVDVVLSPILPPAPIQADTRVEITYSYDESTWIVTGPAAAMQFAKLTGSLGPGSSAAADLYAGDETNLNEAITAYAPPLLSDTIASGSWIVVAWWYAEQKWYVVAYACE